MKVGIGLDNWKLPIFRERLTEAGYSYEDGGALTGDTTLLTVETQNVDALAFEIGRCETECKRWKRENPPPLCEG